jgi:hypothetical protein
MWSQVEHFLDEIIAITLKVPSPTMRLLVGERLTGGRVQILKENTSKIENSEARKEAKILCCNLGEIRVDRNHIMHGMWGWYNPEHEKFEAGALSHKRPGKPFMRTKLVEHHDEIAEETHRAVKIFTLMTGIKETAWTNFFFGPTPPKQPPIQTAAATQGHNPPPNEKSQKPDQG